MIDASKKNKKLNLDLTNLKNIKVSTDKVSAETSAETDETIEIDEPISSLPIHTAIINFSIYTVVEDDDTVVEDDDISNNEESDDEGSENSDDFDENKKENIKLSLFLDICSNVEKLEIINLKCKSITVYHKILQNLKNVKYLKLYNCEFCVDSTNEQNIPNIIYLKAIDCYFHYFGFKCHIFISDIMPNLKYFLWEWQIDECSLIEPSIATPILNMFFRKHQQLEYCILSEKFDKNELELPPSLKFISFDISDAEDNTKIGEFANI